MNNQSMPMHDTFWRNDQVMVVFRSDISLTSGDVIQEKKRLLEQLDLPLQLQQLNQFLQQKQVPVKLHFLDESDKPEGDGPMPSQREMKHSENDQNLPSGVYLFGLRTPIQTYFGDMRTSVMSFLKFENRSSSGMGSNAPKMGMTESDEDTGTLVPVIIRALNDGLEELNKGRSVPIVLSAPTCLSGGTPIGQGCPLTPPIPVKDACSNWHIRLPGLDPMLQSKTGEGVTVFVLDAFPERGVISNAAEDAGDDNCLLRNLNETASFDYSLMSGVQEILDMNSTGNASVGKDVYGRHYPIHLSDHGLFIAGIIRDIAPDARIECVRVLNFLCVGDLQILNDALSKIYNRMLLVNPDTGNKGDLFDKPVVINLSLVIPTNDEAQQKGINPSAGGFDIIPASLLFTILSLAELGALFVASAGNEGDLRESPGEKRPMALFPAALGSSPYSIDNMIAVGAVDVNGHVTSYSCYPGSRGIATYGGEVPQVVPLNPPSNDPTLTTLDALRGIYSSVEYPPLSLDSPAQYYKAPNDHSWAYWVGTSFATPIISALMARILQVQASGSAHDAMLNAATGVTQWDNLDPMTTGVASGNTSGPVIWARQQCVAEDEDEEEIEIEDVHVIVEEREG